MKAGVRIRSIWRSNGSVRQSLQSDRTGMIDVNYYSAPRLRVRQDECIVTEDTVDSLRKAEVAEWASKTRTATREGWPALAHTARLTHSIPLPRHSTKMRA